MSQSLLDRLLAVVADADGSDLHLRAGAPPRIRVNGVLDDVAGAPSLTGADTEAMAAVVVGPERVRRLGDGGEVDVAYAVDGVGRFRVNAYRQRGSVAMVLRRVVTDVAAIDELGLPDTVRRFAEEQRGLVLVAGPTGSGKTTTLAAMVDHINRTRRCHVVTIEDPIEVVHSEQLASISQREVGIDTPTFASAMRAALRQDPDVILVGEMRDPETVRTALRAAETGHLVLSTLHTTDASETISRVVEFFPAHEQRQVRLVLAGVLRGTVCQRLVPTADGRSRVPATEVMVVNGRVRDWILDPECRSDVQEIIARGEYDGMHTFDQSLLALYRDGVIDLARALSAASTPHDLQVMLRRAGLWPRSEELEEAEQTPADAVVDLVERLASAPVGVVDPAAAEHVDVVPAGWARRRGARGERRRRARG